MISLTALAMVALSTAAVFIAFTALRCPSTTVDDGFDWSQERPEPS